MHFLITAGPTREFLDPVRFLSNPSTGRMGVELALAARLCGHRVTLVLGPTPLSPPKGVDCIRVGSAREMSRAVLGRYGASDAVVMAAAVCDYRPARRRAGKMKKRRPEVTLELKRNPDILKYLGKRKGKRVLVGFAAETEGLLRNAEKKLREKNLDMIVANDVTQEGAGFGGKTNIVLILDRDGRVERCPRMTKRALARKLVRCIERIRSRSFPVDK